MASTAHSTRRKANLFGFGGKSTTFSSKALKDAYEAGYKGQSGHRDFSEWLGKQKGSGEFHSKFVGQLRGEYARGEKDYFNRAVTSPTDVAPTVKASHKWKYKGYTIEQAGEDFIVPKLDRESQFESLAEAKRFIMSNPKRNPDSYPEWDRIAKAMKDAGDAWKRFKERSRINELIARRVIGSDASDLKRMREGLKGTENEAAFNEAVELSKRWEDSIQASEKFAKEHRELIPKSQFRNPKRGPIESTVTGATRTGMSVGRYLSSQLGVTGATRAGTSVGRYLDSQLGKVLSNPGMTRDRALQIIKLREEAGQLRTKLRQIEDTTPIRYSEHAKVKEQLRETEKAASTLRAGWGITGYSVDEALMIAAEEDTEHRGRTSNPGTRLTQGGAVAYITELDSGVYAAEVMAPGGAREEKEFKGRGGEEAAKGWARLRLWEVAGRSNPTGDYIPGIGTVRTEKEIRADIKNTKREMKEAGIRRTSFMNAGLSSMESRYNALMFKLETELKNAKSGGTTKSNPESAAASMYSSFHGRDSQELIVIERDEHYHENVAGLGVCCGIIVDCPSAGTVTIGMSGYEWKGKLPKGKWHKSDGGFVKADTAAESVLLSSNEDGTQLFFDGGDQTLDVSVLGIEGPAAQKESIIIGEVSFIAYETEKEFDNFELVQYVHQFSEDSKGPLPQLRYDRLNQQMYLDGGVYFIEQPVMGVSPGIED